MQQVYIEESDANMVGSDTSGVKTANLYQYIESELADVSRDIEVYNVLPCPPGAIQGDAKEITRTLSRQLTSSMSELSAHSLMRQPTLREQIDQVTQLVSGHTTVVG